MKINVGVENKHQNMKPTLFGLLIVNNKIYKIKV